MKSVLISIKPNWCELIASGKKTVEVRKTRPKIETPFKVYIYCTKDAIKHIVFDEYGMMKIELVPSKVIGEFVCDCVTPLYNVCVDKWELLQGGLHKIEKRLVEMAQLTEKELKQYANGKYPLFAWHISDLVIYDEPKELHEFSTIRCFRACADGYEVSACGYDGDHHCRTPVPVTRPPQSYMFVEELK